MRCHYFDFSFSVDFMIGNGVVFVESHLPIT